MDDDRKLGELEKQEVEVGDVQEEKGGVQVHVQEEKHGGKGLNGGLD